MTTQIAPCVCACVRVRACVRACVRGCVCVRACVCACLQVQPAPACVAQLPHGPARARTSLRLPEPLCGRQGEPSPGADVAGASPVPMQMWQVPQWDGSANGGWSGLGTGGTHRRRPRRHLRRALRGRKRRDRCWNLPRSFTATHSGRESPHCCGTARAHACTDQWTAPTGRQGTHATSNVAPTHTRDDRTPNAAAKLLKARRVTLGTLVQYSRGY